MQVLTCVKGAAYESKTNILVDSGVYGSQEVIEKAITESGHRPEEVKAVFLTHAHPDHIGTAHYFREKYGAKIYAGEGERPWIEDIDRQFRERPIPNFYKLAGESAAVDFVVKEGDEIPFCDDILVQAVATPGHSVDEISYRIGDVVFIGDTVPVRGDIPILVDLEESIVCSNGCVLSKGEIAMACYFIIDTYIDEKAVIVEEE